MLKLLIAREYMFLTKNILQLDTPVLEFLLQFIQIDQMFQEMLPDL